MASQVMQDVAKCGLDGFEGAPGRSELSNQDTRETLRNRPAPPRCPVVDEWRAHPVSL